MNLRFSSHDLVTPDMALRLRLMDAGGRREILEAMGVAVVSMGKRAITSEPGLRPAPWKPKVDGKPATLQVSTQLRRSIRITGVSSEQVSVGSDRVYALIHQLGGQTRPHRIYPKKKKALKIPGLLHPVKFVDHPGSKIPARPYLPFKPDGTPTAALDQRLRSVITAKLGLPLA